MIVGVADTSLDYDRTTKAGLYARASVPEYWIVNVPDRELEVYRQPAALSGGGAGYEYRRVERLMDELEVAPLKAPETVIRVGDLLPTRKEP